MTFITEPELTRYLRDPQTTMQQPLFNQFKFVIQNILLQVHAHLFFKITTQIITGNGKFFTDNFCS